VVKESKMKIAVKLKTSGWLPELERQVLIKQLNIRPADVEFEFDFDLGREEEDSYICERVWADMNKYEGNIWDALEPFLPAPRPHTALSVGDEIRIDGRAYVCADFGFEKINP
jgi:hypothetical protein